jgi:hypothetical protein
VKVVIADTSPINYLVLIDAIEILPQLYGRVIVPNDVLAELTDPGTPKKVASGWAESPIGWKSGLYPPYTTLLSENSTQARGRPFY